MATNQANAICLSNSQETQTFNDYMSRCRTLADTSRANNFFTASIVNFKEVFQSLRAQADNFMIAGDAQHSLLSLSGNSAGQVDSQLQSLEARKEALKTELKELSSKSEASDRMFLDAVMHGQPQKEMYPTLQDMALGLFAIGWVIFCIVLVMVRWGSPGGTWRAGVFTFALLVVTTFLVYSLLYNVA